MGRNTNRQLVTRFYSRSKRMQEMKLYYFKKLPSRELSKYPHQIQSIYLLATMYMTVN